MKITINIPSILPRSINVLIYSNYNLMRLHKLLLKVRLGKNPENDDVSGIFE